MACRIAYPAAEIHAADTAAKGIELCRLHQPDLILLDIVLPDKHGLELIPAIRSTSPDTKILILSSHIDEHTLHLAYAADVNGFVDKNIQSLDVLHEAVKDVLEGKFYASASVQTVRARMRADPLSFAKMLSGREMELLRHFGYGKSNEEIATLVSLSPRTVRNHRHNIMAKLGIKSTPQLIRYAIDKGFTRGPSLP